MVMGKLGYGAAVCAGAAVGFAPSTACFVDIDQGLLDATDASDVTDGGGEAGLCSTCSLKVQFKEENGASTTTTDAHLDFDIVNTGSAAQDMTGVTLGFFYTSQGVLTSPTVDCYQVSPGACPSPITASSPTLAASFQPFSPATPTADSTMILAFPGVTIPAGGNLLVRVGLHNLSATGAFDLTKDYSFTATGSASAFADAPNVPLYSNGALIWGTEP
jgi:hypothetical protein